MWRGWVLREIRFNAEAPRTQRRRREDQRTRRQARTGSRGDLMEGESLEAIEYGGTAVGSAEFSRGGGGGGDGRRADARCAAAAEHSAHHDRPAAVGDHRRTVGMPHAEPRPAGARGDAVRAELYAFGGVLSGARHAAERRLSLAQRRVQPGALAAFGASRHEPGRRALLAATARSRVPAGIRRQVARELPAHAARFRFSRSGGDQRLRPRAAAEAGSESRTACRVPRNG